jgi:serine/threonine-protein kinase
MDQEYRARARAFAAGATILCIVGLVDEAVDPMTTWQHPYLMVAIGLFAVVSAVVLWKTRAGQSYTFWTFRVFGISASVFALVAVHMLGIFSPAPVILVLGLAFFVHGRDTRVIYPVSVSVIVAYLLSAVLVTTGLLPDGGVWRELGGGQHVSMAIIVTAVMLTQLVLARANQRALHAAILKSQEIMRVVRMREDELDEARENLDAALRAGEGRFTGAELGTWRLGDVVGRGAMGEVYQASSADGQRTAAVKVLRRIDDTILARRFSREVEIARTVRGPNLVEVLETGETPDGSSFIVMELLSGQDLGAILREQTSLPLSEAVALIEQVARGLEILHKAGVVHRDLKPQNLFRVLGRPPVWKILDYGVAKLTGAGTVMEDQVVGTPGYMSPEQAEGKEVDARSDIFSLGAVAYRAITGRRPFSGTDTPQILYQIVHGSPIKPREIVPTLPREVELALASALAKRPADRFASAAEFAAALAAAVSGAAAPQNVIKVGNAWRVEPITLTMPRERTAKREPFATKPDETRTGKLG